MPIYKKRRTTFNLKMQELILSEYDESKAFYQYTQKILRLGKAIYHIPNEGIRENWYTKVLKAIGLTPGVCDFHYIPRNEKYLGLWIEMKRRDGRTKIKDMQQEEFIEMLLKNGHYATYAYGFDDAIKIYTDYVNNRL